MKTAKRKINFKNENSLRNFCDNIKQTNIHIIGVPGEEREKRVKNVFDEIMDENFPNLMKETVSRYKKHRQSQEKMIPKRSTARHIIIKMAKVKHKETILKAL